MSIHSALQFDSTKFSFGPVTNLIRWRVAVDDCTYSYSGGVILDGDGRAFDLQFHADAGVAFAFRAQSRDAVKLKLTMYQQGAAQGADSFPAMINTALGSWYSTPPGHESYAELAGCANDDQECKNRAMPFYASFPVFPSGRVFGNNEIGTFVAPASGNVLLRVELTCDVQFWSDAQVVSRCTVLALVQPSLCSDF